VSIEKTNFADSLICQIKRDSTHKQFFSSVFKCNHGVNIEQATGKRRSSRHNAHLHSQELALNLMQKLFNKDSVKSIKSCVKEGCYGMNFFGMMTNNQPMCFATCLFDLYPSGVYINFICCSNEAISTQDWGSFSSVLSDESFQGHKLASNLLIQVQRLGYRFSCEKHQVYLQVLHDNRCLAEKWYFRIGFVPIPFSELPPDIEVENYTDAKHTYICMKATESIGTFLEDTSLYEKNEPFILP
jgi:hypothetical protein